MAWLSRLAIRHNEYSSSRTPPFFEIDKTNKGRFSLRLWENQEFHMFYTGPEPPPPSSKSAKKKGGFPRGDGAGGSARKSSDDDDYTAAVPVAWI